MKYGEATIRIQEDYTGGTDKGVEIYWHCTSIRTYLRNNDKESPVTDELFINIFSAAIEDGNIHSFSQNMDYFYDAWNSLYGISDMREIWFDVASNPTEVEIVLQVKDILNLDLATTDLIMNAVLDIEWTDPRLNWSGFCKAKNSCPFNYDEIFCDKNLRSYSHINKIQLESDQIWTPNINVYEGDMVDTNVNQNKADGKSSALPVTVLSNGRVTMKRYVTIRTPCFVDSNAYPFDYQQCNFKFGVRDLTQDDVTVKISKMNYYSGRAAAPQRPIVEDLNFDNNFDNSPEWSFVAYFYRETSDKILLENDYNLEKYSNVEFSFILQRNVPKIIISLMIPLGCLVLLSTFALLIPVSSGENLGYSVTLLLALYVYKETVESAVEPWENFLHTPNLIVFIGAITAMMTLVIAINVGVVHWTNKLDHELTPNSISYSTLSLIMYMRWFVKDGCINILVWCLS